MAILALHLGHNATVVVGAGGVILSALGQEKLDNRKNSAAFPQDAIAASLAQCGLGLSDIQRVVIAGNEVYPDRCYDYLFQPGAPARAPSFLARDDFHLFLVALLLVVHLVQDDADGRFQ